MRNRGLVFEAARVWGFAMRVFQREGFRLRRRRHSLRCTLAVSSCESVGFRVEGLGFRGRCRANLGHRRQSEPESARNGIRVLGWFRGPCRRSLEHARQSGPESDPGFEGKGFRWRRKRVRFRRSRVQDLLTAPWLPAPVQVRLGVRI